MSDINADKIEFLRFMGIDDTDENLACVLECDYLTPSDMEEIDRVCFLTFIREELNIAGHSEEERKKARLDFVAHVFDAIGCKQLSQAIRRCNI